MPSLSETLVVLVLFWHLFGPVVRYGKVKVAGYEVLIHGPIGSRRWLKNCRFVRKSEVNILDMAGWLYQTVERIYRFQVIVMP
jgi:hypothetical protein